VRHSVGLDFSSLARRSPVLLLILAASLLLVWWSLKSATVSSFARARPAAAMVLAPNDPRVIAGLVLRDLRVGLANLQAQVQAGAAPDMPVLVAPNVHAKARQALTRAPLMEDPFLIEGMNSLFRRQDKRAAEMLSHALARNARSRLARLFMLEVQLRQGQAGAAARNMAILTRLMPDAQQLFVPELARMAQDRRTSTALRQALRTDRRLHSMVLQHLAERGANVELILRIASDLPGAPADPSITDWRGTLMQSLVTKGDIGRAYRLWRSFSGVKDQEAGVYDGNFEGRPGLPPFNWKLASSEMGAAEPARRGGLEVQYYGRTAGELASQLLMLEPGRYVIAFHAEGDLKDPQHRLVWRINCHGSNQSVLELPLADITYAGRTVASRFEVPERCRGQWLRLMGEPTEFPKIENVLIRELRIQRARGEA
jgi:hypothetical protein